MQLKPLLLLSAIIILSGCSDGSVGEQKASLPTPNLVGDTAAVQLVRSNWSKLSAHCPGLGKYSSDMTFAGINDYLAPEMGDMARAEVVFKISEDPQKIPNNFRAWGHTCGYGISPDGESIRIQKGVCVSICLDTAYDGPLDYTSRF